MQSISLKYETTLVNVCKKKSYDGVICGHIHHAAIEDYEGLPIIIVEIGLNRALH